MCTLTIFAAYAAAVSGNGVQRVHSAATDLIRVRGVGVGVGPEGVGCWVWGVGCGVWGVRCGV